MWSNWNSYTLLVEMQDSKLLWKTVWQFLKMVNIYLPYDLAIILPGIYPREMQAYVHKKMCIWLFTAALFIRPPKWKQPNLSVNRWMEKQTTLEFHTLELLYTSDACYNIHESQNNYGEWKKPSGK